MNSDASIELEHELAGEWLADDLITGTARLKSGRFEATHEWQRVDYSAFPDDATPVVVGSVTSFNGSDTAGLRLRDVTPRRMRARIEEEKTDDPETHHYQEEVRYVGLSAGPILDESTSVIGEAGVVERNQPDGSTFHSLSFTESYDDPVVFTQIMSYNGHNPCHTRIRNVTSDGFELKIEEWDTTEEIHKTETIGYIVLEEGVHELADGTPIDVSTVRADENWTTATFEKQFGREPGLVSRCQTTNGGQAVVTRHRNADSGRVDVRLQEAEARNGVHRTESIGLLATPRTDIDMEFGHVEGVSGDWHAFDFEARIDDDDAVTLAHIETYNGADTAAPRLRNRSPVGAEVKVEEETSADDETAHVDETIGVVTVPGGRLFDETDTLVGEAGTLHTDQPDGSTWHSLDFDEQYGDPVVFVGIMSYEGPDPSHTRIRNVTPDGCEFQIEEWDYLNEAHTREEIGYLVVEAGTHRFADGSLLEVGTTQSDHTWGNGVRFSANFKTRQPVLITRPQTRNGRHEIVTRTRSHDAYGFDVRVQEEEARGGEHVTETVGYLGIARPDRVVPPYTVREALDAKVSDFRPSTCGFHFPNSFGDGRYTLPWSLGPIDEIGDTSNGMCGGMVLAARDYYEHDMSPWPEDLMENEPPNSPVNQSPPGEDTPLFDFLSERLFDSFKPDSGNFIGAGLYQTLMNSPNTKKWGQIKKSRNEVMRDQFKNNIKPKLDNDTLCPLGLIHVDTHGKPFKTGINKLGDNHQVLAYGYTRDGDTVEIYVYDPNCVRDDDVRIQFTLKDDLSNWFDPSYNGPTGPLYAFFEVPYSRKKPPSL